MSHKDLLDLHQLTGEEMRQLLELTAQVKRHPERYASKLAGKTLAMIFQKPSTRTRVSFQVGMVQLGGFPLVLNQGELQLGSSETVPDTARVLSRYVDAIMARVFDHADVEALATHASVPVINGLSDLLHPCQAICDYFTMVERFDRLEGLPVTYVGDGNNMAHSLANGAAKVGAHLTICTAPGYQPDERLIARARQDAAETGARIEVVTDPKAAVAGAKVVYTDVWASMGQEDERERRLRDFSGYEVDADLFSLADADALFMHCLPAHRGEEVSAEVADGPRSIIFDQAENRLHSQKAVLLALVAS